MSADMTHCRGENCPLRDDCFRYWLHQNSKIALAAYFAAEPFDKGINKCRHFITSGEILLKTLLEI